MAARSIASLTLGFGLVSIPVNGKPTSIDITAEMRRACESVPVRLVAGDTKVVERGAADQMYLCTTGIGSIDPRAAVACCWSPWTER